MTTGELVWSVTEGPDLETDILYDVLALRSAVFVVEQQCAYQDIDGLDLLEGTRHLIGCEPDVGFDIAAYARILPPRGAASTPRIGRVVVAGQARGRQLGRQLMERALACCAEHWPGEAVELGGQAHLARFYESLGFAAVGAPYDEDGIPHVWMRRG
jgi:ElaA protein